MPLPLRRRADEAGSLYWRAMTSRRPAGPAFWLLFSLLGLGAAAAAVAGEVRMLAVEAKQRAREAEMLRARVERGAAGDAETPRLLARAERRAHGAAERRARAESLRGRAAGLVLGLGPVLGLLLACFAPRGLTTLRTLPPRRLAGLAAGLSLWAVLAPAERFFGPGFDPYRPAIVATAAAAAVLSVRARRTQGAAWRLSAAGFAVWLLLWIPFDLRWTRELWLGPPDMGYVAGSLLVSLLGVLAFAVGEGRDAVGLRPPRLADLGPVVLGLLALLVLLVPLGLGVGFLRFGAPSMGPLTALAVFVGLALTVALPEELFFRGVLDAGLRGHFRRPWTSLLVSSLAFGLMHWNNRDGLGEQVAYVALASLAGIVYGLAFRRSGGLPAAVLLHAAVDLVWQLVLRG
ncbi:MAG: CPBP family intramembrane metalloprotease [Planctomycetota bacterium]|nr:MAG: CPBP family intramembrane metalloprotease [Planctomycetota bacterium]